MPSEGLRWAHYSSTHYFKSSHTKIQNETNFTESKLGMKV